jgi:hypothetical protein
MLFLLEGGVLVAHSTDLIPGLIKSDHVPPSYHLSPVLPCITVADDERHSGKEGYFFV